MTLNEIVTQLIAPYKLDLNNPCLMSLDSDPPRTQGAGAKCRSERFNDQNWKQVGLPSKGWLVMSLAWVRPLTRDKFWDGGSLNTSCFIHTIACSADSPRPTSSDVDGLAQTEIRRLSGSEFWYEYSFSPRVHRKRTHKTQI